ncbi:MAG TPA: NTP transferase domain-containing protein [Bacteroidales bacterium]|nr:NTP transferase domain-containing protein [Bacteroidales bacterium]HPT12126.1 NTP transferase domain-containing protein [Bacteroidales bacterium]
MDSRVMKRKFSAIILSAGRSTRMGIPKFSLRFNDEMTFLEKIADSYSKFGCREIVIVMNSDGIQYLDKLNLQLPENARVVLNDHPEWARFYSLKTGVKNLRGILPAFVSNIDNPFISQEILISLSACIEKYDYIYPTWEGSGGHPFLISEQVIERIITEEDDQVHMRDFLAGFRNAGIEVDDKKILLNINTSEEFRKYFS